MRLEPDRKLKTWASRDVSPAAICLRQRDWRDFTGQQLWPGNGKRSKNSSRGLEDLGDEATSKGYFVPADRDPDHIQRIKNGDLSTKVDVLYADGRLNFYC